MKVYFGVWAAFAVMLAPTLARAASFVCEERLGDAVIEMPVKLIIPTAPKSGRVTLYNPNSNQKQDAETAVLKGRDLPASTKPWGEVRGYKLRSGEIRLWLDIEGGDCPAGTFEGYYRPTNQSKDISFCCKTGP